jgi:RIO kinase 2
LYFISVDYVLMLREFRHGGTYKVLRNLLKNKLVHHDAAKCKLLITNPES